MKHTLLIWILTGMISFSASAQDMGSKHVDLLDQWYAPDKVPNGTTAWYNEVWGFVHNGNEYAVIGSQDGMHFIEITAYDQLIERDFVQGKSFGPNITNRDMYVWGNYMYTVCDQGYSSLQIIDISYLPDSVHVVYDSDSLIARAHTLWVDEAKKKLYVCGPTGYAMKIFDVSNPVNPQWLYTHTQQYYIHDCYVRNDTAFLNAANEGLYVYKFTNLVTPYVLGVYDYYPDQGYNHSGKLNKNGSIYVFADESDGKRVKVCDATDLTDIETISMLRSNGDALTIAHDPVFFRDEYVMISYYYDGLVIFDVKDPYHPELVGWYDTYTGTNAGFRGAWGVYAGLPSERILVSDRMNGLFLFRFNPPPRITSALQHGVFPNPMAQEGYFWLNDEHEMTYDFRIYDATGRAVYALDNYSDNYVHINAASLAPGCYTYRFKGRFNGTDVKGRFIVTH